MKLKLYTRKEVALSVGDRVTLRVDSPWLARLPEVVARYAGGVGEVIATSHDGCMAQVRFPDGRTWEGLVTAFVRQP